MKPGSRSKTIILSFAAVALVATGVLYAYLYEGINSFITKTQNAESIVRASAATRAQGKDILKLRDETATDRARLASLFVPTENAVIFIKSIEDIAFMSGAEIKISSIKSFPPNEDSKNGVGTIVANITSHGTWTQVMKTLELFQSFKFVSSINDVGLALDGTLALDPKSTEVPVRKWQLSLTLKAFTLPGSTTTTQPLQ